MSKAESKAMQLPLPAQWALMLLLSAALALLSVRLVRQAAEEDLRDNLAIEAERRAIVIMGQTLNGNVMGSVTALALVDPAVMGVVLGQRPANDPQVLEALQVIGRANHANGVFVVDRQGVVQSAWDSGGVRSTGLDVGFRPYFRIAMQGRQNVYAAVSLATRDRALYFSTPIRRGGSIAGAAVARLPADSIDTLLRTWHGPALLLSPQQVTFASNHAAWAGQLAQPRTPAQLKAIRELRQFGSAFERNELHYLPFDASLAEVQVDGVRYAVARASVEWNDPNGAWSLVLLGDLDAQTPWRRALAIGLAIFGCASLAGSVYLSWRRRLLKANQQRRAAEVAMRAYADQLATEGALKSWLSLMSTELQQTTSLEGLATCLMSHLFPRVPADYAVLYVRHADSDRLMAAGAHGVVPEALEEVQIGQGLVGQCARDVRAIELNDNDDNADADADAAAHGIRVTWGAASAMARSVLLLPLARHGRLCGVLVLASLRRFETAHRDLLDAVLDIAAMNLEILARNVNTAELASALQRQQAVLRDTEAWYRAVVESAPDGMVVVDGDGSILLANAQMHRLFDYPPGTLLGQSIDMLVPLAVRQHHPALRQGYFNNSTLRPMGSLNKDLRGLRRDGSSFPIEVGLVSIDPVGTRTRCVCASVRARAGSLPG